MRRIALIVMLLALTSGTVGAQALNLRTGGWNLTIKSKSGGEVKTKTCLTKEDIDAGAVFQKNDDAEHCKTTFGTRTAARVTGTIVCTGSDPSRSTYEIVAHSPEMMTMKTKTDGTEKDTLEVTGRFASASCKGYEN